MPKSWKALFFSQILLLSVLSLHSSYASTEITNGTITTPGVQTKPMIIDPPLKQIKYHGIATESVTCIEGLVLIKKLSDNSPACVKPYTAQKLVERGWGKIVT